MSSVAPTCENAGFGTRSLVSGVPLDSEIKLRAARAAATKSVVRIVESEFSFNNRSRNFALHSK